MGCGANKSTTVEANIGSANLSKYCLRNLFELCRYDGSLNPNINGAGTREANAEDMQSADEELPSSEDRIV